MGLPLLADHSELAAGMKLLVRGTTVTSQPRVHRGPPLARHRARHCIVILLDEDATRAGGDQFAVRRHGGGTVTGELQITPAAVPPLPCPRFRDRDMPRPR